MHAKNIWRLALLALTVALGSGLLSCSGGGGEIVDDPLAPAPQIFGLDKSSANVGDTVLVVGNNFGAAQGSGNVTLNGVGFTVNTWTNTQISATVIGGMTSGIVTVTQNSKSSMNGQEAQLYIGAAPTGNPVIFGLSPDYGRKGEDEILITGSNFGSFSDSDTTGVFFSAELSVAAAGYVKAQVVLDDVTSVPQWTQSSIRVIVPSNAKTGDLYVLTNGNESNHKPFEAQPPAGPSGDPLITTFSPESGPVGTQVTIQGNNFGNSQGNSTASISGVGLNVIDWTNTQILATIPAGAETAAFNVTVGGITAVSGNNFVVANSPVITGVAPTNMRVGQPLSIFGNFFGFTQGAGTLRIGSSTVAVTTWTNTSITVDSLPGINAADVNNVPIIVKNDPGLESLPFPAKLVSDITGLVTVRPKAGVATKTNFKFNCSASGGSGNYEFELIPDNANPGTTKTGSLPIGYIYDDKGVYETSMRITDKVTGDMAIVSGPTVNVVGPNDMVITQIDVMDFQQPGVYENDSTSDFAPPAFTDVIYNDFVFFQGETWFTSALADLFVGNTKLPAFERDQAGFLAGSSSAKPYAYRRTNGIGSSVRIHGFNFGTSQGNIYLDSAAPLTGTLVDPGNITGWGLAGSAEDQDELIEFVLPSATAAALSGFVVVERTDNGKFAKSVDPLLCSAQATLVQPDPVALDGTLQITGYDLTAPVVEGVSGSTTALFWVVQASYTDPFGGGNVTRQVLCVHPIEVSVNGGNLISFNMADLDRDAGAAGIQNDIQAYNIDGSQYQVVLNATLQPGAYQFFVWTGADLTSGSNVTRANSGLMSEVYNLTTLPAGGGGGGGANAVLNANPQTGGPPPLGVNFNAGASTSTNGVGTYRFEFEHTGTINDPPTGGWDQEGAASTANHNYAAQGTYTCMLEVVDSVDGAETDRAIATITVTAGGGGTPCTAVLWTAEATGVPQPNQDPPPYIAKLGVQVGAYSDDMLTQLIGQATSVSAPQPDPNNAYQEAQVTINFDAPGAMVWIAPISSASDPTGIWIPPSREWNIPVDCDASPDIEAMMGFVDNNGLW